VGGRGGDPGFVEALSDGGKSESGGVFLEKTSHDGRGFGIGHELVQGSAFGGFAGIGVRTNGVETVAVGWPSSQESSLMQGL
jgi:hypothetical protein